MTSLTDWPWCCFAQPSVHWFHHRVHSVSPVARSPPCSAVRSPEHNTIHAPLVQLQATTMSAVHTQQESQLSQTDRALLRVIEYFTKSLKVIRDDTLSRACVSHYYYSIVTMLLSCIISEIKRYIGRKLRFFHTPLHSKPPLGSLRQSITIPFGVQKLHCVPKNQSCNLEYLVQL